MLKLIIGAAVVLLAIGCESNHLNNNYPKCVQSYIDNFLENNNKQTPSASVDKYLYKGDYVYVLNFQNFPDGQSSVISTSCEPLCSLGGFDGPYNDCEEFEDAKFIETVWVDPR